MINLLLVITSTAMCVSFLSQHTDSGTMIAVICLPVLWYNAREIAKKLPHDVDE